MDELIGFDEFYLQRQISTESLYYEDCSEHELVRKEADITFDNQSVLTTIDEQKDECTVTRAVSRSPVSSLNHKSPEHNDDKVLRTDHFRSPERSVNLESPKKQVSSVIERKPNLPYNETPHRLSRSVPESNSRRQYTSLKKAKMTKKSHKIRSAETKIDCIFNKASSVKLNGVDDRIEESYSPSPLDYKTAMSMFPRWMILDYGKDLLSRDDFARLMTEDKSVKTNKQSPRIVGTRSTRAKYPVWMVDEYGKDLLSKEESIKRLHDRKRMYGSSSNRSKKAMTKVKPTKDESSESNLSDSIKEQISPEIIYLEECNNGFKPGFRKGYTIQGPNNPNVAFTGSMSHQSLSIDESTSNIDFSKRKGYILNTENNAEYKKIKLELTSNIEKRPIENCKESEYMNRQVLVDYIESDIDFSKRKGYILSNFESANKMQLLALAEKFNAKYNIPKGSISNSLTNLQLSKSGASVNSQSPRNKGTKSQGKKRRSVSEKNQPSTQRGEKQATVPKNKLHYTYTNSAFKEELTDAKATLTRNNNGDAQTCLTKNKKGGSRGRSTAVSAQKKALIAAQPDIAKERAIMNSPIVSLYFENNVLPKPSGTLTWQNK